MAIIFNVLAILLFAYLYKDNTRIARYAASPDKRMKAQFWRGVDGAFLTINILSLVLKLFS